MLYDPGDFELLGLVGLPVGAISSYDSTDIAPLGELQLVIPDPANPTLEMEKGVHRLYPSP